MKNFNDNQLKIGTEKNFGIVFGTFFFLLTAYIFYFHNSFNIYTVILSLIFNLSFLISSCVGPDQDPLPFTEK